MPLASRLTLDSTCDVTAAVNTGLAEQLLARATGAAVAVNSTSVINIASATNTVAAGDTFKLEMIGRLFNNSGAARTYTVRVTLGSATFDLALASFTNSASNIMHLRVEAEISVISASLVECNLVVRNGVPAAVGTTQNDVLAQNRTVTRNSATDQTGIKSVAIGIFSSVATATQTFSVGRATIHK